VWAYWKMLQNKIYITDKMNYWIINSINVIPVEKIIILRNESKIHDFELAKLYTYYGL